VTQDLQDILFVRQAHLDDGVFERLPLFLRELDRLLQVIRVHQSGFFQKVSKSTSTDSMHQRSPPILSAISSFIILLSPR
jgi:hypothetical protein